MNSTVARLRDLDREHPAALDSLLAAMLFVGAVLSSAIPGPNDRVPGPTLYVLLLLGTLPYAWRRRSPLAVLGLASIPVIAMTALGYSTAVIGAGLFLAAYTVAACSRTRVVAVAAGFVVVLIAVVLLVTPHSLQFGELATNAALFIGAFALGRSAHDRRRTVALLRERAELAERAQAEEAGRAVADERLRIARELHDVLAHSLGVIALQAGVGAHVIDADPAEAKATLTAVAERSRTALTEVRRILGALRERNDDAGYSPMPGLDAVGELAAELTRAGLPVHVCVEGDRGDIPAALDLTAYRLVQESLTNVVKHAGTARAEVTVRYQEDAVTIEVVDDGHPAAAARDRSNPGHGQLGMRERVAVFGGSLTTGARPGGGYSVTARLPYLTSAR
ncbi:MAG: sensor histidine kinase [Cellulomonas sp.]